MRKIQNELQSQKRNASRSLPVKLVYFIKSSCHNSQIKFFFKERRPRLSAAPEWAPHLKLWKFKERRGAQTSKYGNFFTKNSKKRKTIGSDDCPICHQSYAVCSFDVFFCSFVQTWILCANVSRKYFLEKRQQVVTSVLLSRHLQPAGCVRTVCSQLW
jgi:hypothetical protein